MSYKLVMTAADIKRTLARIAHEIVEKNKILEKVIMVGMHTRGVPLAHRLAVLIENRDCLSYILY